MFELDGAHIAYAMGINAQRDIATVRRLIERRIAVDAGGACGPGKAAECYAAGKELKGHVMANGTKERVGIVGVGRMGFSMLKHLVKKGFSVTACDLSVEAVKRAVDAGATSAESPAALAKQCDFVILGVGYTDEVNAVVYGPNGLLENLGKGAIIAVSSTTSPYVVQEIAAAASRRASASSTLRSAVGASPPTKARCWRWSAASTTSSSAGARSIQHSVPTTRTSARSATARSARP